MLKPISSPSSGSSGCARGDKTSVIILAGLAVLIQWIFWAIQWKSVHYPSYGGYHPQYPLDLISNPVDFLENNHAGAVDPIILRLDGEEKSPCFLEDALQTRVAINPKSQVVRRAPKRWKKVVHTAKMLPYEVEKGGPARPQVGAGPVRQ